MKSVIYHLAVVLILILTHGTASAQDLRSEVGPNDGETEFSPDAPNQGQVPSTSVETLAKVSTSAGNYVVWLYDQEDDLIQMGVAATFPNKPIVAAEFMENHDPIQIFLAAAPLDQEVPRALIDRAPRSIALPSFDVKTREELKHVNEVALAHFQDVDTDAAAGQEGVAGCSVSFRNWVAGVYGSSTCGNPGSSGFTWTYPTDTYCTSGCDYKLGELDKGQCTPSLASCDIVRGKTFNRRQRLYSYHGNPTMSKNGRHAHYGAANCSGNGSFKFFRQRGGSVYSSWVPVNGMLHYYQGAWSVPVIAKDLVTYGSWTSGLSASGSLYKTNKTWLTHNGGTDDRAILCGDVRTKYEMQDISAGSCHGPNVSLCTGNGDCDSPCFDCVGGSC